jgi:hypothetical protein
MGRRKWKGFTLFLLGQFQTVKIAFIIPRYILILYSHLLVHITSNLFPTDFTARIMYEFLIPKNKNS